MLGVGVPTGATLLRAIAAARWLAWGWMVSVVVFSGDALRRPIVAWSLVAEAWAWLSIGGVVLIGVASAVERAVSGDDGESIGWRRLRETWR